MKKIKDLSKCKKLKNEKRMNKYTYRAIRRVPSYGKGKYVNKTDAVCFWTKEGGNFVSFEKGKIGRFMVQLRFKIHSIKNSIEDFYKSKISTKDEWNAW